jgi:hypothetical protein
MSPIKSYTVAGKPGIGIWKRLKRSSLVWRRYHTPLPVITSRLAGFHGNTARSPRFLTSPDNLRMRRTGSRVTKKKPVVTPLSRGLFQSLPNTDPGLAGETGVSGEVGTVYGLDRLNTGGGTEGTLFRNGLRNPSPTWPPLGPPPSPRPAAKVSVATAVLSVMAARRIIVLRNIDLRLMF